MKTSRTCARAGFTQASDDDQRTCESNSGHGRFHDQDLDGRIHQGTSASSQDMSTPLRARDGSHRPGLPRPVDQGEPLLRFLLSCIITVCTHEDHLRASSPCSILPTLQLRQRLSIAAEGHRWCNSHRRGRSPCHDARRPHASRCPPRWHRWCDSHRRWRRAP